MSLELALNNHSAALLAFADALKNSTLSMATISVAPATEAPKAEAPKVEAKAEVKAEKPTKVEKAEKPAKVEKKVEAKPEHPTLEDLISAFTPFLAKDHPNVADNKVFVKTILTKFGADKVSTIKETERQQALDWLTAREADDSFEIDAADDEGMV